MKWNLLVEQINNGGKHCEYSINYKTHARVIMQRKDEGK